jgi:hypothetical protein
MVAILIQARMDAQQARTALYKELLREIQVIVGDWAAASPVHRDSLSLSLSPMGVGGEVMVRFHDGNRLVVLFHMMRLWLANIGYTLYRKLAESGNKVESYIRDTVANSDYQKFDGMLRMVLDLSDEQYAQLDTLLTGRQERGEVFYGLHCADSALMTCMVFSRQDDHVHFIDGNDGGYAVAALQLKDQRKRAAQ